MMSTTAMQRLLEALIEDECHALETDPDHREAVARSGHTGFEHMALGELKDEFFDRGLEEWYPELAEWLEK